MAQDVDAMALFIDLREYRKMGDGFGSTFVQVGAHDGLMSDMARYHIEKYKWPGVLIEPQPNVFPRLKANYAHRTNLVFEEAAITPNDGPVNMYRSKDPRFYASMLSSIHEYAVRENIMDASREQETIKVRGMTVATLLKKHGLTYVDYLFTDTEGCDYNVIDQFLACGIKPALVYYENWGGDQVNYAHPGLAALGYSFQLRGIDVTAILHENQLAIPGCDKLAPWK